MKFREEQICIITRNEVYRVNFRNDFDKVSGAYSKVESSFKQAVSAIGTAKGTSFGSENGVELDDLRDYHYMFGMPYFDETEEFGDFRCRAGTIL